MDLPIPTFSYSLICGAFAGLAVDLTLYPIDTVKTRLQSQLGFQKSGGFRSIYAGIPSVAVGSAPGSALFFVTYESVKNIFCNVNPKYSTFVHMTAASVGEVVACFVRVPTEVVKQRAQATNVTTFRVLKNILTVEGVPGLYRGFSSTIAREVPFSLVELPIWEYLKYKWSESQNRPVSPWQGAACGSLSGAFAAGITTPLDVAKTRIMLSEKLHGDRLKVGGVLFDVWQSNGLKGLYAGILPRMTWMALGGFIFFGAYEKAKEFWSFKIIASSDIIYHPTSVESLFQLGYEYWFMDKVRKNSFKKFDDVIEETKREHERRTAFLAAKKAKEKEEAEKKASFT